MTAEGLGATIDDCLVEFARHLHLCLVQGGIGIEVFNYFMDKIKEGQLEDTALRAFKLTLQGGAEPRLASESYFYLARRHALDGGMSPPTLDDGRRFVRVFLARFMKEKENWKDDWDIQGYSRFSAYCWWRNPYPNEHLVLIQNSRLSAAAWDTLQLICEDAVKLGHERIFCLPRSRFGASGPALADPKRPDEGSIPLPIAHLNIWHRRSGTMR